MADVEADHFAKVAHAVLAAVVAVGGLHVVATTVWNVVEPGLRQWAIHNLRGRSWELAGVTSDTALAAYLVRPGQRTFNLDDLALRYLRRELKAESATDDGQLSLLELLKGDADVTAKLSADELTALFDLGYHMKHVDTIFDRVFGAA